MTNVQPTITCHRAVLMYLATTITTTISHFTPPHPQSAGVVICLERGADLHMAHCHSLSLASVKSRLDLVPAHPVNPGQSSKGRKTDVCMYAHKESNSIRLTKLNLKMVIKTETLV